MYRLINDLRAPIELTEEEVIARAKKQRRLSPDVPAFIYRKSLDPRKDRFSFVYSVAVAADLPDLPRIPEYTFPAPAAKNAVVPVVGFGPAGMFCAWLLAKCGVKPLVIERGRPVEERVCDVENFWRGGGLDPESNVAFGEGGAGTFSDGKLTTRVNDPRCRKILETFVSLGAPRDILKDAKPHVGTDRLREEVRRMREEITALGGQIRFRTRLTGVQIDGGRLKAIYLNGEKYDTDLAVLAIGHSARDTYEMLLNQPLSVTVKPFSVGFRAEHDQDALNRRTYGAHYGAPQLGPADYLFHSVTNKAAGEAVYSFCMCPGGTVVNASSQEERLVTNGMSNAARDGKNANAAILASVHPETIREAFALQDNIEQAAYRAAEGLAPATTAEAFLNQEKPAVLTGVCPTFLPGVVPYDVNQLFPSPVAARLREGFALFRRRILGDGDAVLTAPETRTSAPLRILRGEGSLSALGADGLYPCGEGAGYAGGIMSAAADGMRVAEQIIRRLQ